MIEGSPVLSGHEWYARTRACFT